MLRGFRTLFRHLTVAVAVGGLCSCASHQAATTGGVDVPGFVYDSADRPAAREVEVEDLLAVDEDMREFVRTHLKPVRGRLQRLRHLSALLLDPGTLGIRYDGDLTLSASETFHQRAGNCLSFSALLISLAREAGLSASFQDVPVVPNWRPAGKTFVVERHVNALVQLGASQFEIDFRPPDALVFAPRRRIADVDAVAQYYGNLGVERLTRGDKAGAYALFRQGLAINPGSDALWINLGVTFGRNGQLVEAEAAYRNALQIDPGNLSALSNLAVLQETRGDRATAQDMRGRVEKYRRQNPYYLLWRGEQQLRNGQAEDALENFSQAVRRMSGEAEFHYARARALLSLGRSLEAERAQREALRRGLTNSARTRYRTLFQPS